MTQQLLFPPPPHTLADIVDSDLKFPVRRIFCVGRNYHAHAAEMGVSIDKSSAEPFYFMKDPTTLVQSGACIDFPPQTSDLQHEMELVVALGVAGFEVDPSNAGAMIYGYACGLDLTRRDLQQTARKAGKPWDLGKNFEQGAVLSPIVPRSTCGMLSEGRIELSVNGATRQASNLQQMIWSPVELIVHLSRFYHLQPGDLLFTGTPEGVAPLAPGDTIEGRIERVGQISLRLG